LIFVIWLTGILAVLALSFSGAARVHVRLVENARSNAQAELMAEAGVRLALVRLLTDGKSGTGIKSLTFACTLPDQTRLSASISDEAGRVDLNFAGRDLIVALLASAGLGETDAQRTADGIAQARTQEPQRPAPQPLGKASTPAADLSGGRRPGPFESVEDLRGVAGLRRDVFEALRPYMTVHSGLDGVDPNHASPALIKRLAADGDGTGAIPRKFVAASTSQGFLIRAGVVTSSGSLAVREAVVSLLPQRRQLAVTTPDPGFGTRARPRPGTGRQEVVEKIWEWRDGGAATKSEREIAGALPAC
jgi:general secretion pathway protein K